MDDEAAGGPGEPAGGWISWARIVSVVASGWNQEARQPAARVRLNAIAAQTSQAAFAGNNPDGRFAYDLPLRSS